MFHYQITDQLWLLSVAVVCWGGGGAETLDSRLWTNHIHVIRRGGVLHNCAFVGGEKGESKGIH